DQHVREDQVLEGPVVRYKHVSGWIGKWHRHRITGSPRLNLTIIDGEAEEVYAGTVVGRIDVRPAIFEIAFRISLDVPVHKHSRAVMKCRKIEQPFPDAVAPPTTASSNGQSSVLDLVAGHFLRRRLADGLGTSRCPASCRGRSDFRSAIRRWQRPTRLIGSERDPVFDIEEIRPLAKTVTGAKVRVA